MELLQTRVNRSNPGGFTLPETQVTLALFVLVVGGMMVTYLFGYRLFQFIQPKLNASDQARVLLGKMSQEIKTAAVIKVGTGDKNGFTEVAVNSPQKGTSLQIYPTSDTNYFVRYFWNATDLTVKRLVSSNSVPTTMATSVTNQAIFSAQDFAGNVLTNNQNNRVISMTLQFFQADNLLGASGTKSSSDFFQLQTRVTRRSLL